LNVALYIIPTNGDWTTGEGGVCICFLFDLIAALTTINTNATTAILATVA